MTSGDAAGRTALDHIRMAAPRPGGSPPPSVTAVDCRPNSFGCSRLSKPELGSAHAKRSRPPVGPSAGNRGLHAGSPLAAPRATTHRSRKPPLESWQELGATRLTHCPNPQPTRRVAGSALRLRSAQRAESCSSVACSRRSSRGPRAMCDLQLCGTRGNTRKHPRPDSLSSVRGLRAHRKARKASRKRPVGYV